MRFKKSLVIVLAITTALVLAATQVFASSSMLSPQVTEWGGKNKIHSEKVKGTATESGESISIAGLGRDEYRATVYEIAVDYDGYLRVHLELNKQSSGGYAILGTSMSNFYFADYGENHCQLTSSTRSADIGMPVEKDTYAYLAVYDSRYDSDGKLRSFTIDYTATMDLIVSPTDEQKNALTIGQDDPYIFKTDIEKKKSYDFGFKTKVSGAVGIKTGMMDPRGYKTGTYIGTYYITDAKGKVKSQKRKAYLNKNVTFGVYRKKNYHIVFTPARKFRGNIFTLKLSEKKLAGYSKKKSKAVTLKKSRYSYVPLGTKAGHWYKVKCTKKGYHKFTLTSDFSGKIYMNVWTGQMKITKKSTAKVQKFNMNRGTYYVYVYTKGKTSNGAYKLTYK